MESPPGRPSKALSPVTAADQKKDATEAWNCLGQSRVETLAISDK